MKILIIFFLLGISIFGQSGKSVLTQAQKDSIQAMIDASTINIDLVNSVSINDYIGVLDTSLGWSYVIQAAVDANLGSGKNILFEGDKTYLLQQVKINPYYLYGNKTCVDLKTGGLGLVIPSTCTLKLKDGQQVDGAPVDIIVYRNASNIYIGGGGTITGNTAGQTGWTGGYGQITSGTIIWGIGTGGRKVNKNITIDNLTLIDHFSNPFVTQYTYRAVVSNILTYGVGEGLSFDYCDEVFVSNYIAYDSTDVSAGDVLQFEVTKGFYVNNVTITDFSQGGGALELYGSQDGIISNFRLKNIHAGVSLGNPDDEECANILFTDGVMDSVTNYMFNNGLGENITFNNIRFSNSSGGLYNVGYGRTIIKNSFFDNCHINNLNDAKANFINCYFLKTDLGIVGNATPYIPDINVHQCVFDSSLISYGNQGHSNWYATGNLYNNDFTNRGDLSYTITGVLDSLDIDGSGAETVTIADAFNGVSLIGRKTVMATSTGYTLTTISAGTDNQELDFVFNHPQGTGSIITDKIQNGSGNIRLSGNKTQRFIGGDIITLKYLSDSSAWCEKSRSGTKYGFNKLVLEGWYCDNVPDSATDSVISRGNGTITKRVYVDKDCYIKGVGVASNEARITGTLTIKISPNSGTNFSSIPAVLDSANTTKQYSAANRGLYTYSAGTYFEILLTTSNDWTPTTADVVAWIELEY